MVNKDKKQMSAISINYKNVQTDIIDKYAFDEKFGKAAPSSFRESAFMTSPQGLPLQAVRQLSDE